MTIVIRRSLERHCLPKNLARVAIQRDHFERVLLISANTVGVDKFLVA
jgi:hypothetical protein